MNLELLVKDSVFTCIRKSASVDGTFKNQKYYI